MDNDNVMKQYFKRKSGIFFGMITAFVIAGIFTLREKVAPNLPAIQILFITMLISFFLNYYLVRDKEVLPYLENEDENFKSKVCAVSSLLSAMLFIHSFQQCELKTSIYCASFAWVFFTALIQCQKNLTAKLDWTQLIIGVIIVILTFVILMPNFDPELESFRIPLPNEDETADQKSQTNNKHMLGVISAFTSGLLFGYMTYCYRQLKKINFITLSHVFCYMQAPFVPVFYPIQKLITPTLPQWGFMLSMGICLLIAIQFLIRCSQRVSSNKSLLIIPQFIAFFTILSLPFKLTTFGPFNIIHFISAIIIIGLCLYFDSEIETLNIPVEAAKLGFIPQQFVPLEEFRNNDNLFLAKNFIDMEC